MSFKVLVKGDITKYSSVTATDLSSYEQNTKVYVSVTETSITRIFSSFRRFSLLPVSVSSLSTAAQIVKS